MFEKRNILIATKHQKEKVIAPLLEQKFKMQWEIATHFDTDSLGTFTGEIERKQDPIKTLRKKCIGALEGTTFDLVIASEGSFGPHPHHFFATANEEWIMLFDKKNELEITVRELTTHTNFNGRWIENTEDLKSFAKLVEFPEHRLILRKHPEEFCHIHKGIGDFSNLEEIFLGLKNIFGKVYAETDMRAMYNPTRMSTIESAMKKLVESMESLCPSCNTPGFSVRKTEEGLPCAWCNQPTKSVKYFIKTCLRCDFEEMKPNQLKREDPAHCDFCNP